MRTKQTGIPLAALLLFSGCIATTPSRNGTTRVRWINEGVFAVNVAGRPGSTADAMGRRAMLEACKVTRDRGYAYYAVGEYVTAGGTQQVQTQEEGVDYILNSTGQAVGAITRSAKYETSSYGNAFLTANMISPGSIDLIGRSLQIIDANSCRVHSRPD